MTSSSSSSPEILGASSQDHFSYKHATHEEVLEDLSSRFILNLPDDELSSLERICFQVEQAHWFYEDFIREENPKFPSLPLKKFSAMLFHACPLLHQWSHDHEQAFNNFMQYKTRVPVCGAIMLNDTWEKCLLVKGWKSSSGWGFPKGKINQVEPPASCAIREVLEETGYNLAGQLDPENVIEMSIKEQKISLFIVPGVPEDYPFKTKTRKEISKIEWFRLTDLPTWKRNKTAAGRFYLISPFIGALKAFINERKPRVPRKALKARKLPTFQPRNELHSVAKDSVHESSSQSSSAEPQTPSPQYVHTTKIPQVADHGSSQSASDTMDPHFAHLLSALATSASANENKSSNAILPSSTLDIKHHEDTGTPIPITTPRADLHASPRPTDNNDWSSSMPQHRERSLSSQLEDSSLDSMTPSGCSLLPLPQIPQSPIFSADVGDKDQSPMRNVIARRDVSSRSPSSRPPLKTTDISPHISPPIVSSLPANDRTKQHIALLEAVSAESARLMQAYKTAAANGVPVNVTDNFKHPLPPAPTSSITPYIAGQTNVDAPFKYSPHDLTPVPAMVPPQIRQDHRVLYTSGPSQSSGLEHAPVAQNATFGPMYNPFQVRPRTSLAYHRGPMNPNPSGSASMNQTQLLALMNGPLSNPPLPYGVHAPPRNTRSPLPPFNAPVLQRPRLPFHPPQFIPTQIPGSFTSVPTSSLHMPLQAPPPTNNTLLSILNSGRSASRVTNATPYPPTPNGRG
ncbi:hypothetical protein D9615_010090 [Tricholomella constricta]|uniref:Nudix hydrolase domain-containing protein n=1 Tax=Tricholomella constricta TaxID=117010 RepID=A0A8H5GSV8_9AGAR|nr:hypothetical protein D9615_010090 [Tricholomella constricta]